MKNTIKLAAAMGLILLQAPAFAQQEEAPTPTPKACPAGPGFDDFDFWVGDWKVTTMDEGVYVGDNTITKVADGCVLLEDWNGIQNARGYSINYFNLSSQKWRQVWVDNAGYSIDYEGELVEGAMVMTGTFFSHGSGATMGFRGTWTPLENGDVRQTFEFQNPEDGTWKVNWDARYSSKSVTNK